MKNLKTLSDSDLLSAIKTKVQDERRISIEVLWHLREVESRRLYCGRSSLYEYCVQVLGYSKAAAHRRVSSMRALKQNPELETPLSTGALSMSAVTKVQTFFRQEKFQNDRIYSVAEKKDLFASFEGKSEQQIERELVARSPQLIPKDQIRLLTPQRTEIRIVLDESVLNKIRQIQNLCSHQLKDAQSLNEVLDLMADLVLTKIDPMKQKSKPSKEPVPVRNCGNSLPRRKREIVRTKRNGTQAVQRYVQKSIRIETWKKADGRCIYKDPVTGHVCNSQFKLQIEHKIPFAKGGTHFSENLTLLCAHHQQVRAIQEFGQAKMAGYLKDSAA